MLHVGPGMWTDHGKDTLFVPELSKLSVCGARPLGSDLTERDQWLGSYILNTAFRYPVGDPVRQLGFAFLRRVDQAVSEYAAGQLELAAYISAGRPTRLTRYSRGLAHFEACMAAVCQSLNLGRRLIPGEPKLFEKDDGSDVQRLWELYNASKHLDERIRDGESAPESTLHVWITNTGLKSRNVDVSFDELRGLVDALADLATKVANPP